MSSKTVSVQHIIPHRATKGSGKNVILFLHGWGGSTDSFEKLSDRLITRNKDITCILLDLPGFGKTAMPPKEGWTTYQYAEWLYHVIEQEKTTGKIILYGHSFGCRVIVRFLQKHEDKVEKVILTGAAGIKWPPTAKQKVLRSLASVLKPLKGILPKCHPERNKAKRNAVEGSLLSKIQRKILRLFGAHDWEQCPEPLKPTLTKTLEEPDLRDDLQNITLPTLLLWGAQDTYTPLRSAKVYQEHIKDSQLIVYPNGRHGIHYTHSEVITDAIVEFMG